MLGNRPPAAHGELLPGMSTAIGVDVGVAVLGLVVTGAVLLRRRAAARRTPDVELVPVTS